MGWLNSFTLLQYFQLPTICVFTYLGTGIGILAFFVFSVFFPTLLTKGGFEEETCPIIVSKEEQEEKEEEEEEEGGTRRAH